MLKKKLVLYVGILFVFTALWFFCVVMVTSAADRSFQKNIQDAVLEIDGKVSLCIEGWAKNLIYSMNSQSLDGLSDPDEFRNYLANMARNDARGQYLSAHQDGTLYDEAGILIDFQLDKDVLHDAQENGYSVAILNNYNQGMASVAIVVPVAGNAPYYLVQIETAQSLLEAIHDMISPSPVYTALYTETGMKIASEFRSTDDVSYATMQSVQFSANEYTENGFEQPIRKFGANQDYNVFVPLKQAPGYFIGCRIGMDWITFVYSNVVRYSMLILAAFVLFIGVILLVERVDDKRNRALMVGLNDALTGLLSADGMENDIQALYRKNSSEQYSLVCMDIVAFHRFNAMFGYTEGDMLLKTISDVIKKSFFCGARIEDDVFAFAAKAAPALVDDIERDLRSAIEETLGQQYVQIVTFKYGIYPDIDAASDFRNIYDGARLALREAKKTPALQKVIYDSHLQKSVDLVKRIELHMLHALSKGEFLVYIHPKIDVRTGYCCGGEALIRWQSEQMGFMMPDTYIPLFEQNGIIVEIDIYMLSNVMKALDERIKAGQKVYPISVNQSRITLTFPNYISRLENLIHCYDIPLEYIEIEVTESVFENDKGSIEPLLQEIKKLGFSIAMDDFGKGYSSLNALRELPVDVLKIDMAFLKETDKSEKNRVILKNIIHMSKELGIGTVCEGVETDAQLSFLRENGCDVVQGYLFAKPMPYSVFKNLYLDHGEDDQQEYSNMA